LFSRYPYCTYEAVCPALCRTGKPFLEPPPCFNYYNNKTETEEGGNSSTLSATISTITSSTAATAGFSQTNLDAIWAILCIFVFTGTAYLLFRCFRHRQQGGPVDQLLRRLQESILGLAVEFLVRNMRTMTDSLSHFLQQRFG
jgi:acid phosphatase family membrane protein YuiD